MNQPDSCNSDIGSGEGQSRYTRKKIDIQDLNYDPNKKGSGIINAGDSFRDSVGNISKEGKRLWIYPQQPKGDLHNKRTIVAYILLAILVITPFIKVGENPLFMFNILERKFVLFGLVFWPQDFHLFALAFLILFIFVILFTSIFGRVWCGWACPQTIFMEMVFRKIEYWLEGNSNQQRALAARPWDAYKIRIKGTKFAIFYAMSFLVANLLLSYIIGVDELWKIIKEPVSQHISGFTSLIGFSGIFFFVFAWFREQACTFVCPYGRLQSVLLDKNTLVVAYDFIRGEKREKYKKKGRAEDSGDCIDCRKCTHVCPTGIDIRDGTQLECVNCTACIDACDEVMLKIGKPKGLIRFASQNQIETKEKFRFTPRLIAYAVFLTLLMTLLTTLLITREDVDIKFLRAKGQLYTMTGENRISNLYTFKMINKTTREMNVGIDVSKINGKVTLIGKDKLVIPSNTQIEAALILELPLESMNGEKNDFMVDIVDLDKDRKVIDVIKVQFSGPAQK